MALITQPTPWQEYRMLKYNENINLAVFGGRGAGRTTGALFAAMRHCEMHGQGAHVLFIRQMLRSLREVEDNLHLMLQAQYGDKLRVNRQDHIFIFPGGATIEFSPINDVEDMAKLQGRSFSLVIADEYGNFNPPQMRFVDQLRANLRAGNIPCRFILLANPGGRGHQSIKERFVDRMVPYEVGMLDDQQLWAWTPANYTDNPHNPENYAANLFASALRDQELFRAWAQGDWNIARGAMFADVIDEGVHRVRHDALMKLFNPEHGGSMHGVAGFLAADWGQTAPAVAFACLRLLAPRDPFPAGSLLLVDEVSSSHPDDRAHGLSWPVGMFAENMEEMCKRCGIHKIGVIDDAKGLQPEDTLIKGMLAYGFSFIRPMKNRRSGWSAMRELLSNTRQANGKAGQWVAEKCAGWWETVPLLPRNPANQEDADTTSVDHWADANRYGACYEIGEARFNSTVQTIRRYPQAAGPSAPTLG
jgi:hypothetical protein